MIIIPAIFSQYNDSSISKMASHWSLDNMVSLQSYYKIPAYQHSEVSGLPINFRKCTSNDSLFTSLHCTRPLLSIVTKNDQQQPKWSITITHQNHQLGKFVHPRTTDQNKVVRFISPHTIADHSYPLSAIVSHH